MSALGLLFLVMIMYNQIHVQMVGPFVEERLGEEKTRYLLDDKITREATIKKLKYVRGGEFGIPFPPWINLISIITQCPSYDNAPTSSPSSTLRKTNLVIVPARHNINKVIENGNHCYTNGM